MTAWAARWGTTVMVWPADSGPLFDALAQVPDGLLFTHPEGQQPLNKADPESVFDWVGRGTERGYPDEVLAWIVRDDPDSVWDGVTVG